MRLLLPGIILLHTCLFAQLPNTNVYLFDIEQKTDSLFLIENPKYLTHFNKDGYNNQPNFVSEDVMLLTLQRPGDDQTDIYAFNLKNHTFLQITGTAESEYSPSPIPSAQQFSSIRVETDEQQTQRLWTFPLDRSGNGQLLLPDIKDIGYHYWINENNVALFIVSDPHYLLLADIETGFTTHITSNIGRCFQLYPDGNLAYLHKITDASWQIKKLNLLNNRSELVVRTISGSEDFVMMEDGTILTGSGSKLYKFHPRIDTHWLEIADFRYYGIQNITRLACKSNTLAIVNNN